MVRYYLAPSRHAISTTATHNPLYPVYPVISGTGQTVFVALRASGPPVTVPYAHVTGRYLFLRLSSLPRPRFLLLFCSSLAAWQFLSSIHLIFFFSLCFVFLSNPHCYHHRCALSFAHNPPYPHVILRYSLYLPCPWRRPCLCRYRRLND